MTGQLKLHPLLADHSRLLIMSTLAASKEALDFMALLALLGLTRGNLSAHLRRLEEQELVEVSKDFVDRKPRTSYRCTEIGRAAIKHYLESVELMLKEMK